MSRCPVCGGASTCPAGLYEDILTQAPPMRYSLSGGTKGHTIPDPCDDDLPAGYRWQCVGSVQRYRVLAHYPTAHIQWCGQTKYWFAARLKGDQ